MSYRNETGFFRSQVDGLKLFYQKWEPPNAATQRTLVFHHGFGEHSGRYGNLLEACAGKGITLYAMDARGHGRSEGKRGDARGQVEYVRDLEAFLSFLRERFGVRLPALLGHSLGGAIVLMFGLRFSNQWEVSCILTSGAALRVRQNLTMKIKKAVGSLLFGVKPDLTVPAGIDVAGLSHDPKVIADYQNDPLVHGDVTARMALDLLEGGEEVIRRAALLKVPLFMAHGQADPITDPGGTVAFSRACGSSDSQLVLYPGLYHEIFNEPPEQRDRVFRDLLDWLEPRFSQPASADPGNGQASVYQADPASTSTGSPPRQRHPEPADLSAPAAPA